MAVLLLPSFPLLGRKKKKLLKDAQAAEKAGNSVAAETLYCELATEDHKNKQAQQKCSQLHEFNQSAAAVDQQHIRSGITALNAGNVSLAIDHFKAVKTSQYIPTAQQYLTQIIPAAQKKAREAAEESRQAREREQKQAAELEASMNAFFQQGIEAYQQNDFSAASNLFVKVTSGPKQEQAQAYVSQITRYETAMADGSRKARAGRYKEALLSYRTAARIKKDGPENPEEKIARILELIRKEQDAAASAVKEAVPVPSTTSDKALPDGIAAFYAGSYESAEATLKGYNGTALRNALARFYLGVSELTRYYLAGSADKNLYASALKDLQVAKNTPGFVPPSPYISPRILRVYDQVH